MSNVQKLLISIVSILVVISVALCVIVLIYISTLAPFVEALSFAIVLLVASIPMAIEIVTTTTLALGSKELTHENAIVSRLAAIEDMAGMTILCSDKTGTLTLNKMVIQDETPVYKDGETQHTLLRYAASKLLKKIFMSFSISLIIFSLLRIVAAKWHEPPKDALDTLVLGEKKDKDADRGSRVDSLYLDNCVQTAYKPFDPTFKRTEGSIHDKDTGKFYKVSKGAPEIILK